MAMEYLPFCSCAQMIWGNMGIFISQVSTSQKTFKTDQITKRKYISTSINVKTNVWFLLNPRIDNIRQSLNWLKGKPWYHFVAGWWEGLWFIYDLRWWNTLKSIRQKFLNCDTLLDVVFLDVVFLTTQQRRILNEHYTFSVARFNIIERFFLISCSFFSIWFLYEHQHIIRFRRTLW